MFLQYTVDMLTFVLKLFEPNRQVVGGTVDHKTDPKARILLSHPVEIATVPYEMNVYASNSSRVLVTLLSTSIRVSWLLSVVQES